MELLPLIEKIGNVSGLGVIFLVLYVLYRDGIISFGKRNGKTNGKIGTSMLAEQISQLQQHYNHEITGLLREIRDGVIENNRRLEELDKYGVLVRGGIKKR